MVNAQPVGAQEPSRYLRQSEVLSLLGISRITLYEWRRRGLFPAATRLGPRLLAWPADVVRAWQDGRPAA